MHRRHLNLIIVRAHMLSSTTTQMDLNSGKRTRSKTPSTMIESTPVQGTPPPKTKAKITVPRAIAPPDEDDDDLPGLNVVRLHKRENPYTRSASHDHAPITNARNPCPQPSDHGAARSRAAGGRQGRDHDGARGEPDAAGASTQNVTTPTSHNPATVTTRTQPFPQPSAHGRRGEDH